MAYVDTQFLKKILAYDCETTIFVPVKAPHVPVWSSWSGCAEHAEQDKHVPLVCHSLRQGGLVLQGFEVRAWGP